MEPKDYLPLIGVVVGWFLKEFSDAMRQRSEARGTLGTALVGLLELDSELSRLGFVLKFQKARPISWEQYEAIRQATAKRYLTRTDPTKAVEESVSALARYDPVQAAGLRDIPNLLTHFQKIKLQAVKADGKADDYVKMLSILEVSVSLAELSLRKFIVQMAKLHGPLTWFRVRWRWHREKSKLSEKNEKFTKSLLSELYPQDDENSKDLTPSNITK